MQKKLWLLKILRCRTYPRLPSSVQFSSVAQSCLTLLPNELQHTRPSCPSPTPGVHSNSCPSSRWCHPAISPSVVPFSCPQSFPASESFPMSQLFAWSGQSPGVSGKPCANQDGWVPLVSQSPAILTEALGSLGHDGQWAPVHKRWRTLLSPSLWAREGRNHPVLRWSLSVPVHRAVSKCCRDEGLRAEGLCLHFLHAGDKALSCGRPRWSSG